MLKKDSNGNILRYKACLVAKGFTQQPGLDFTETFSPMIKMAIIQLILSLMLHFCWDIHQFDVKNAFLHGFIIKKYLYGAAPWLCGPKLSKSRL